MDATLAVFLAGQTAGAEERHNWGAGNMPLQLRAYLTPLLPPLDWVTSVRSLVFRGGL